MTTRGKRSAAGPPAAGPSTRVLELSYQLSALEDREAFLGAAGAGISDAFRGEVVSWNDVYVAAHRFDYHVHPRTPESAEIMSRLAPLAGQHPVVRSFMTGTAATPAPRRVSDVASAAEWRRSRVYQEPFRELDLRHQLGIIIDVRPGQLLRGWAVVRSGRDFSDDAMILARHLQPLLVALDRMYSARTPSPAEDVVARFRLTPRETEVLRLLALSCTAHQIGTALRISERTVHKHLENLYAKLGCRDRLGAVLTAQQAGLALGA